MRCLLRRHFAVIRYRSGGSPKVMARYWTMRGAYLSLPFWRLRNKHEPMPDRALYQFVVRHRGCR